MKLLLKSNKQKTSNFNHHTFTILQIFVQKPPLAWWFCASMMTQFLWKIHMAIKSKYQDVQLDALVNDLIIALEKHKAPADLSLMALGNLVTNILKNNFQTEAQRHAVADSFASALKNSLK